MKPPARGGGGGGRGSFGRGGRGGGSSSSTSRGGGRGQGRGRGRASHSDSRSGGGFKRSSQAHSSSSASSSFVPRGRGGGDRGRGRGSFRGGGRGFAGRGNGFGNGFGRGGRGRGDVPDEHADNKPTVDLSQASKVALELQTSVAQFKSKLHNFTLGKPLEDMVRFVPPQFVNQHLPPETSSYRSYLTKFNRGTNENYVVGFLKWYEWASYESNKGKTFSGKKSHSNAQDADHDHDEMVAADAEAAEGKEGKSGRAYTTSRAALAQKAKEREHVRALLQMCLRHNSARRKEGQHALLNLVKEHLTEAPQRLRSLEELRETTHHSIVYMLSRLLLGMATDNIAAVALNCQMLFLILSETNIPPTVMLTLMNEELAFEARMAAMQARLEAADKSKDTQVADGEDVDNAIDPDDINDPTKGERNQRIAAAVFAMGAMVASGKPLSQSDVHQIIKFLCFTYVEQRGLRVFSTHILLEVLRQHAETAFNDQTTWNWIAFAFFRFPKLEYYRPEAVELLIFLMDSQGNEKPIPHKQWLTPLMQSYVSMDPLRPDVMESLANALFRKEQVTIYHPMVHPVWDDLFNIIVERCAAGESLKQHLSAVMHTVIVPYRRGAVDEARRVLFQRLVGKLGQLAFQHTDAEERVQITKLASDTVGFGKTSASVGKPSDVSELRFLPVEELAEKVSSLIVQLNATRGSGPGDVAGRTWAMRELRTCLQVPLREGIDAPYVNEAVMALLRHGFFPPSHRDDLNKNRSIFIFAEAFSFTYRTGGIGMSRPKCTLSPLEIATAYLSAEEKKLTRFNTAVDQPKFRKARNRIVEALEWSDAERSVLFYASRDMQILLALLFLIVSTDDPLNEEATNIATTVVPDLIHFYKDGTIESVELLYDVLMALVMRNSMPMHIIPIMTCVRRVAVGFLLKFARFVKDRAALDLVLAPLREAFDTDIRETLRQKRAKGEKVSGSDSDNDESGSDKADEEEDNASSSSSSSDSDDEEDDDDTSVDEEEGESSAKQKKSGKRARKSARAEEEEEEEEEGSEAATEADGEEEGGTEVDSASGKESEDDDNDDADSNSSAEDEEDEGADDVDEETSVMDTLEEEEAPTQQYIESLERMVGRVEVGFIYPTDTDNKEKAAVVRAVKVATRVGLGMRSPLIVDIFQVFLAVLRENLKADDSVIFDACQSAVEMLLLTKNRYYGNFVNAEELFQLLGDIQSYCRKLEHSLVRKDSPAKAKEQQIVRRRLGKLKQLALNVLHFTAYIAYKNHADEEVRISIAEYYKSIFYDRGWDVKRRTPGLKRDLYFYRHGFAWALLPGIVERVQELQAVGGALRARSFVGCCDLIEAILPRISGLPRDLKLSVSKSICTFFQLMTLHEIFESKHVMLYNYFHCLKMTMEYNSKVNLDTEWVSKVVDEAVDDDSLQVSGATIRLLGSLERILDKTPRARETKVPTPVKVLHQQFMKKLSAASSSSSAVKGKKGGKTGKKDASAEEEEALSNAERVHQMKSESRRKAKRVREKVVKALLSHRNEEKTDYEKAAKRHRREELKIQDRLERQLIRETRNRTMTKEEKEERRRKIQQAKQERVARNRDRKRQLHLRRQEAFKQWRANKLASAGDA